MASALFYDARLSSVSSKPAEDLDAESSLRKPLAPTTFNACSEDRSRPFVGFFLRLKTPADDGMGVGFLDYFICRFRFNCFTIAILVIVLELSV